jgi:Restriction endonuclease S subunits
MKAAFTTGAAIPRVVLKDFKRAPIKVPPLPTQRRIASILSAYDDLIENNTRRIAILEEMARRIYEEWFVRFRFPGHEQVKMVESELGLIPEGWKAASLGEVSAINTMSIRPANAPEEILYIDIASVVTGAITQKQPYRFSEAPGRARRVVQNGDVIWSCVRPNRRSYALVLQPEPTLIASTGFAVLSAKSVPYSYLYFAVTTNDFVGFLTNHATGAAYPAVTASTFESAQILMPQAEVADHFHSIAAPMLDLSETLKRKNTNLRATRDLLLPKLISGELDVSSLPEPEEVITACLFWWLTLGQ